MSPAASCTRRRRRPSCPSSATGSRCAPHGRGRRHDPGRPAAPHEVLAQDGLAGGARSRCSRPTSTSVFLVTSLNEDLNLRRLERYLDARLGERRRSPSSCSPSPTPATTRRRGRRGRGRRVRRARARDLEPHRRRARRAPPVPRARRHGGVARLVRRREVDARQLARRPGAPRHAGDPRGRQRPPHDHPPRADRCCPGGGSSSTRRGCASCSSGRRRGVSRRPSRTSTSSSRTAGSPTARTNRAGLRGEGGDRATARSARALGELPEAPGELEQSSEARQSGRPGGEETLEDHSMEQKARESMSAKAGPKDRTRRSISREGCGGRVPTPAPSARSATLSRRQAVATFAAPGVGVGS